MRVYSSLVITDGTERISFQAPVDTPGFNIDAWRPGIAEYKGGGTWQDSPIADGRQLAYTQWATTVESWGFKAFDDSADALIRRMQDLKRLLIKGVQYWTTSWQTEPVWIERLSPCETYKQYAHIRWWALPEEEFPYGGEFYQVGRTGAGMDNLTLMLEHLLWADTIPGTGSATSISGTADFCYPWYLVFDGDTQDVDCGSDAGLDDLPDNAVAGKGQITVEAWIKADSYGEGNLGRIMVKGSAPVATRGWHLFVSSVQGLQAYVDCATQDAISASGLDEFTADGEWHHVMMVYDETGASTPAARTIYLAVDGTWIASYSIQQVSIGNYSSDAGDNLFIGNRSDGNNGFDGGIGWARVSSTIRETPGVDFTPDPQCTFPGSDATTLGLWIREGDGTAIDNAEGTAARDGTAANDSWDCDCDNTFGRAATTAEEEVFVANKHNVAQLTHVFVDDGGAFGANLVNQAAYELLPSFPAVNDAVYFGIDSTTIDSGPFCSLIFDILTAMTDVTGTAWEYWNGAAWGALTTQDNTNADGAGTGVAFDTAGVRSVHWEQQSNWATTTVNGITGYWVRLRITAIGAAPATARQQNRPVYTVTWPYIELASTAALGDVAALARAVSRNQSDIDRSNAPELWTNRIVAGLRSLVRGGIDCSDFTPYINLSDEQNNSGITIAAVGVAAFATDERSPTGRLVRVTNKNATWATQATISISAALAQQYIGTHHWFLRAFQTSGAIGDMLVRFVITTPSGTGGSGGNSLTTDQLEFPHLNDFAYLDIGQIELPLPGDMVLPAESGDIFIAIQMYGTVAATVDADLYDLILMPVDEWAADFKDPAELTANSIGYRSSTLESSELDFGSVLVPRRTRRAVRKISATGAVQSVYAPVANGPVMLQANAAQRLWFLHLTESDTSTDDKRAWFELVHSVHAQHQARYLNQRGDR